MDKYNNNNTTNKPINDNQEDEEIKLPASIGIDNAELISLYLDLFSAAEIQEFADMLCKLTPWGNEEHLELGIIPFLPPVDLIKPADFWVTEKEIKGFKKNLKYLKSQKNGNYEKAVKRFKGLEKIRKQMKSQIQKYPLWSVKNGPNHKDLIFPSTENQIIPMFDLKTWGQVLVS